MKNDIERVIDLLEQEAENPPHECDQDSYTQGILRARDELVNLLESHSVDHTNT